MKAKGRSLGGIEGAIDWLEWKGDRGGVSNGSSRIEWDEEKAQTNLTKQGISFVEATTVFDDPNCLIMDDPKHSIGEFRFLILGYSIVQRLLLVVHCDRRRRALGERGSTIRIISARPATPSERRNYERGY